MPKVTAVILTSEEQTRSKFTHVVKFKAGAPGRWFTNTSAASTPTETFEVDVPKGTLVRQAAFRLPVPIKDVSDAAFNSLTLTIGDAGSANRYMAATQLNENGTEILYFAGAPANFVFVAAGSILLLFTSTASKALTELDVGELDVFLDMVPLDALAASAPAVAAVTGAT